MKLQAKHIKYSLIGVTVIGALVLFSTIPFGSKGTSAGELLDKEIELQQEKQSMLDQIEVLDQQILETRELRNKLHKEKVCTGSGCYISSF